MLPIHVTVWDDGDASADQVILVHGTLSWGSQSFAQQRPLAQLIRRVQAGPQESAVLHPLGMTTSPTTRPT